MASNSDMVASPETEQPPVELGDASHEYVRGLPDKDKKRAQQEIQRFVRWLGPERPVSNIAPPEIGDYGDMIGAHGTTPDAPERLKLVKDFLAHLRKQGHVEVNLAQHLRLRKGRSSAGRGKAVHGQQVIRFTKAGIADQHRKLEQLQLERVDVTEEIQRAAQDKDVRENAPLEAARERQGMLMARIVEIEANLKTAVVIDSTGVDEGETRQVRLGSKVTLRDVDAEKATLYQLVAASEANPLTGKISNVSPVGSAIMGCSPGDQVKVQTPRGSQTYEIIKIG